MVGHRRDGVARARIARFPGRELLREEYRTDDGDTDERWASAVMLSYLGLMLVIGAVALYWTLGPRGTASDTGGSPSYYLGR